MLIVVPPAGFILSMLFLRGVGKHFNNRKLTSGPITYMIVYLVTPLVLVGLWFMLPILLMTVWRPSRAEAELIVVVLFAITAGAILVLFLWYMGLVRDAQHTISRAVRRATARGGEPTLASPRSWAPSHSATTCSRAPGWTTGPPRADT